MATKEVKKDEQVEQTQQFNQHQPSSDVVGQLAPNVKPARLQEVEDDAMYIQQKRFDEHFAEAERNHAKAAAQDKKGK